ncbi:MAG TPA: phosphatase PAP2 family protein, partial [Edaphobacter sp.]
SPPATAATPKPLDQEPERKGPSNMFGLPKQIIQDQVGFFKSPASIRVHDLKWILPVAAATGAALASDTYTMRNVVSRDTEITNMSARVSDVMRYSFLGGPTLMVFLGRAGKNEHFHSAGLLGMEAFGDAYLVSTLFKFTSYRERPFLNDARGHFFSADAGSNSSFPSGHSMTAFAAATVLAEEYPTFWKQAALYSLATGVGVTRILGERHFPSDVLIGSVGGWMIGHYVHKVHHPRYRDLDAAKR